MESEKTIDKIPEECYRDDVQMHPDTIVEELPPLTFREKHHKDIRFFAVNAVLTILALEAYRLWS